LTNLGRLIFSVMRGIMRQVTVRSGIGFSVSLKGREDFETLEEGNCLPRSATLCDLEAGGNEEQSEFGKLDCSALSRGEPENRPAQETYLEKKTIRRKRGGRREVPEGESTHWTGLLRQSKVLVTPKKQPPGARGGEDLAPLRAAERRILP